MGHLFCIVVWLGLFSKMSESVVVCSNERRIGLAVCESPLAYFSGLY